MVRRAEQRCFDRLDDSSDDHQGRVDAAAAVGITRRARTPGCAASLAPRLLLVCARGSLEDDRRIATPRSAAPPDDSGISHGAVATLLATPDDVHSEKGPIEIRLKGGDVRRGAACRIRQGTVAINFVSFVADHSPPARLPRGRASAPRAFSGAARATASRLGLVAALAYRIAA